MTPAAPESSQPERPDAFISYSRHDGEFVSALVRALEARGKDVWVDLDDIPKSADWHARVEQGIEAAKAVVVVLSPALAASQICGEEIRHAIEHNKRLIPILRTDVEPEQLYPELNAPNWILARESDDGGAAFEELVGALETDLAWLEIHARLVARSVEWDRKDRDGSFLLRGDDLKTAERWLAQRADHREQPTELQVEYIGASRRSTLIRRAVAGVAVLGVLALAGFLLVQRERTRAQEREAERQAKLAESRRLSADAIGQLESDPRRGLATALRARKVAPTPEATRALRLALMEPQPERVFRLSGTGVLAGYFVDSQEVVLKGFDRRFRRWRVGEKAPVVVRRGADLGSFDRRARLGPTANLLVRAGAQDVRVLTTAGGRVLVLPGLGRGFQDRRSGRTASLSPDGRRILVVGSENETAVWKIPVQVITPRGGARAVCARAARSYVVTCDNEGLLSFWRSGSLRFRHSVRVDPGFEFNVRAELSSDGRRVYGLSTTGGTTFVVDARRGAVVARHPGGSLNAPTPTPDGRKLYIRTRFAARITDARTGTLLSRLAVGKLASPVASFSSRGDRLATSRDETVSTWDVGTGHRIAVLGRFDDEVGALSMSPSGSRVSAVSGESARIWKTTGGKPRTTLPRTGLLTDVAFSDDGSLVVTAGEDGTARVYETETGHAVASFAGHREGGFRGLVEASFGPGGRTVITVGFDGAAVVHECPACAAAPVLIKRARAALRASR